MKAIALTPQTTQVALTDIEEPSIQHPEDVKIKVWQVGICGTDREQAEGGRSDAPKGRQRLIIGHEMFGQVVAIGDAVKSVQVGEYGLFTVRRGCGKCMPCRHQRSDMCLTGEYTERGIKAADGYQSEFVVDKEAYLVTVPESIRDIGILTEPMSVVAKAIGEALNIQQARFKNMGMPMDMRGQKALVAGVGAIGLLAAFALVLRGAEVYGMDIVDAESLRPQLLQQIGGTYIDGRNVKALNLDDKLGQVDFIFEAAGVALLQFELMDALGVNGIYVATGLPGTTRPIRLNGASLMQQLVLKNQVVLGSVNASIDHYRIAVDDLLACHERWPQIIRQMISEHIPFSEFEQALHNHQDANEIKVVVDWV